MKKNKGYKSYTTSAHPEWLKDSKCFEYWDDELREIVQFFVINSICDNQSYRNYNLTNNYNWKKGCWRDKNYLKNCLDKILFNGNPKKLQLADSYKEIKQACKDNNLEEDFYMYLDPRCSVVKSSSAGCQNKYMSMFYHVRNSIAHGRFIIKSKGDEQFLIMEDVKPKKERCEVNFRMVVSKESLVEAIKHIKNGPKKEMDYENAFLDLINSGKCTKGKICNELGLDKNDNVWKKTIEILKSKNLIKYKNKRWEIVNEV